MPRLLRLMVLLVFISTLLIFVARLIGRTRPALPLTTIMTNPDGTACDGPCLFGVQPGKTSLEQAKRILAAHPLTHDGDWVYSQTLQLAGPDAYVAFSLTKDGLIDGIALTDDLYDSGIPVPGSLADSIQLGEILLTYGTPIVGLPGSDYFVVEYPNLGILVASARPLNWHKFVEPSTPMSVMMITDLSPCPTSFTIEARSWIGFTTIQHYQDAPRHIKVIYRNSKIPIPPPYAHCPT